LPLVDVCAQSSLKKERESACRRCYDVSVSQLDIFSIFIVHFMVIQSSSLPSFWETDWILGAHPFSQADVAIDVGRTTRANFNARRQSARTKPDVTALRQPTKMGSSRHASEFIPRAILFLISENDGRNVVHSIGVSVSVFSFMKKTPDPKEATIKG